MKCMQFCAVRSFTRSMPSSRLLYILPALLLLAMAPAQAQLTTAEEKGLPPNSVFHLGDIDAINLQNGQPLELCRQSGSLILREADSSRHNGSTQGRNSGLIAKSLPNGSLWHRKTNCL
jgi:hypothetical protein